jgi:hypothetical protein
MTLLPVSEAYCRQLVAEGVSPSTVVTLPSTVEPERFRFSPTLRQETRSRLTLPDGTTLGLYVGEFGDNYYDVEAFKIFSRFSERLAGFQPLVMTPMPDMIVHELARRTSFPPAVHSRHVVQ